MLTLLPGPRSSMMVLVQMLVWWGFPNTILAEDWSGVINFSSPYCAPCQQMAPIVEKLQREGLPLRKVDTSQHNALANQYRISSIPAFVLLVDGQEVDRVVGAMSEADLRRYLDRVPLAKSRPAPAPAGGQVPVQVALGEASAFPYKAEPATDNALPPRPEEQPVSRREAAPEREPSKIAGLWPFGRNTTPLTVRGNDVALGETAEIPNTRPAANQTAVDVTPDSSDPMAASVRLRVHVGNHVNLGSGTIISSREGVALVLTCGHIFRGFDKDSKIEVDLFSKGQSRTVVARLEKYDLESDLGLIALPSATALPRVAVAERADHPRIGAPVACIGCSGGELPTRDQIRVTEIDKYDGPSNIECTGIPVQGRSGGGLFDAQGKLIGVCIASDPKEQRGLYSGLLAIHSLLDELQLTHLYELPSALTPERPDQRSSPSQTLSQQLLAGNPANPPVQSPPVRSQTPSTTPDAMDLLSTGPFPTATPPRSFAGSLNSTPVSPVRHEQSPPQRTTLPALDAGGGEAIVILADRSRPGQPQQVYIIHEVSPKFMQYLRGELQPRQSPDEQFAVTALDSHNQSIDPLPELNRRLKYPPRSAPLPLVQRPHKGELSPTSLTQTKARPYVRSAETR